MAKLARIRIPTCRTDSGGISRSANGPFGILPVLSANKINHSFLWYFCGIDQAQAFEIIKPVDILKRVVANRRMNLVAVQINIYGVAAALLSFRQQAQLKDQGFIQAFVDPAGLVSTEGPRIRRKSLYNLERTLNLKI